MSATFRPAVRRDVVTRLRGIGSRVGSLVTTWTQTQIFDLTIKPYERSPNGAWRKRTVAELPENRRAYWLAMADEAEALARELNALAFEARQNAEMVP